jgi:hypothetical protein
MSTAWSSDFSYAYFRRILQAIKSRFKCHPICEAPRLLQANGIPKVILRHDIDISLAKACQMAEVEAEYGLRATYMVINNGLLYSLTDVSSRAMLHQLMAMGHEVALHFDIGAVRSNGTGPVEIETQIDNACKQLEDVLGSLVESVSFHRPGSYDGPLSNLIRGPFFIAGRINAYAADLLDWYLSDSKGSWRDGEPLPKLLSPVKSLLQLLIHPIWWGEEHMAPEDRLEAFFLEETQGASPAFAKEFDERLAATIPALLRRRYQQGIGKYEKGSQP